MVTNTPDVDLTKLTDDELDALERRERARLCREDFGCFFMQFQPKPDYRYGRHTYALLDYLDWTTKQLERGKSTYLVVNTPPRHGKSDCVSRRWPVWHLGRNPDHEMMMICHGDDLATTLSVDARNCFKESRWVFPTTMSDDSRAKKHWRIDGHDGGFYAAGIGGDITGRGGHVIVVDDYLRNREDAESTTVREKLWDAFTHVVLTRVPPVHAVVIVATRWHEDDIVGRIRVRNDPKHEKYEPDFPRFRVVRFPAQDEAYRTDGAGDGSGWLFPERFPEQYYRAMRAGVAEYGWNSEYQQEPRPRRGNMLRVDCVKHWIDPEDWPALTEGVRFCRGWDLASTKKERSKSDPDFSVGTLAGYKDGKLYVDDVVAGQWSGMQRDERMRVCAEDDGPLVTVIIEVVGGYKDAFERAQAMLAGVVPVKPFRPATDKVARAACLEAVFELGNVYAKKADWNAAWRDELSAFPSGRHDDRVDSLVVAVHDMIVRPVGLQVL